MILLDIALFLGRFHPLIVHLPIGFLLMAALLLVASYREKFKTLHHAVPFALLMGSISSAFACITGYFLSLHGDYDPGALQTHMITGIVTALTSFLVYLVSRKKIPARYLRARQGLPVSVVCMMILVFVTGHLGGSLTHGPAYLGTDVLFEKQKTKRNITRVDDALVFEDLVQPILSNKCGNCHSPVKKKGQLSLADLKDIEKGGKHGKVIVPGDPLASEMIKRISLHPDDEKFMPADGKTPLTPDEATILKWWIEKAAGAPDKKLVELKAPAEVMHYAAVYFNLEVSDSASSSPDTSIRVIAPSLNKNVIAHLVKTGFAVKYIHLKPDLLDIVLPATVVSHAGAGVEKMKELLAVKENIVWLDISGNNIGDAELEIVRQFSNLQRLKLNKTGVTDSGIRKIKGLTHLQSVNLYNTAITRACLPDLSDMESLTSVYAWGTSLKPDDLREKTDSALKITLGF